MQLPQHRAGHILAALRVYVNLIKACKARKIPSAVLVLEFKSGCVFYIKQPVQNT